MSVKLYYTAASPPCRASLLTIKALNLEVDLTPINLATQEHLTTDFLKINPFHCVPTIQEKDFSFCDSHAINCYLVDKYGQSDELYPTDLAKRAIVNQRLHFDSSILGARLSAIGYSILHGGVRTIPKDKWDSLLQGLTSLETILESSKYVAGPSLTIADFSIVATVTTANVILPLAANRFPKIFEWIARLEALPYYKEANQEGLDAYGALIKSKNFIRQTSTK